MIFYVQYAKTPIISKFILHKIKLMLLDINLRIEKSSYDILKSIKNWYNSKHKKIKNNKELVDYIFNEFIRFNKLDYIVMNPEEVKDQLNALSFSMKYHKIDNLDPSIHEIIESCKQYFESKNEKKTINDVIKYSLSLLIDLHPEINEILEKNRLIKLKDGIEKSEEKMRMEKIEQGKMPY